MVESDICYLIMQLLNFPCSHFDSLKLPPPSRNCADTFLSVSFFPYEWNKLDERIRQLTDFNMFNSELFYVILIISMISLFTDYNNIVILNTFTFMPHYID